MSRFRLQGWGLSVFTGTAPQLFQLPEGWAFAELTAELGGDVAIAVGNRLPRLLGQLQIAAFAPGVHPIVITAAPAIFTRRVVGPLKNGPEGRFNSVVVSEFGLATSQVNIWGAVWVPCA